MGRELRKLLALSAEEWKYLLWAYLLILGLDIGLRCVGFYRIFQWVNRKGTVRPKKPLVPMEKEEVGKIWHLVDTARRSHFCRAQCLHRSLVVYWLLRGRGVGVDLCIGVQKEAGEFRAHAWVEYQGQIVVEPVYVQEVYAPLMRSKQLGEVRL